MADVLAHVAALFCYPVKSCRGIALDAATLDRRGIVNDRAMMIVDDDGRFLTQRSHPKLALIEPRLDGAALSLSAPGVPPISIPVKSTGETRSVLVWHDECLAIDQGHDVAEWLSAFLEDRVSLVRIADDFARRIPPAYALKPSDEVTFVDAYPLLVVSEESVHELNARLSDPVLMNRFRPNIVVRGAGAHAEDRWRRVRIGDVTVTMMQPCTRCSTVTVDQETAVRGKEPLRTLAGYRNHPELEVIFGQRAIHSGPGTIRVGDSVTR